MTTQPETMQPEAPASAKLKPLPFAFPFLPKGRGGSGEYRFGTPGYVEFEFPDKPYPPRERFSISDISGGSLNFVHIKFKSGEYDYVIYHGSLSGLYVKKKQQTISKFICEPGIYQRINRRVYRGVRTVPPVVGVDD